MRVAALCDVHGNLPALEAVLAGVEREGVDAVGAGVPRLPPAAAARIVRGNADRLVLERDDTPLGAWCADRLGPERLDAVARWPLTLELDVDGLGHTLVCHATPHSDDPIYTRLTPDAEGGRLLGPVAADVVVCGHTHIKVDRRLPYRLR